MSLHPIDISAQDMIGRTPGDAPRLDWLAITDLRIDDDYQRPLGKKNWTAINRIAREFDWSMFTPVLAAPLAGGAYALIDGQHRVHAAALIGLGHVPAMVVDVPPALQAAAFAAVNSQRVAMSPFHVFKAELAAGNKIALAAAAAVDRAGCRLMTYNSSFANRKPREIYCIAEVRSQITAGRDRIVTRALSALTGSERADQVDLYQHRVLRPWFAVFADEPGLLQLDLARFVTVTDLRRVADRASALREQREYAGMSDFALRRKSFRVLLRQAAREGQIGAAA